jgi:hypothetical protein
MTQPRSLAIVAVALAIVQHGCGAEAAREPSDRKARRDAISPSADRATMLRALSTRPLIRRGVCDASAGVALDSGYIVVANDENNVLLVYRADTSGDPVTSVQLSEALGLTQANQEADIEGATFAGDTTYWITSHSNAKDGTHLPERHRFFATIVEHNGHVPTVRIAGRVEKTLLTAVLRDTSLARFDITSAAKRPPEAKGGLNIEGLAATKDGRILIGFRNPIPSRRALIVPIENPGGVIFRRERLRLGRAMTIDLGGRGIRSMEYVPAMREYVVVAGPFDDRRDFALYRWTGSATDEPRQLAGVRFDELTPEGILLDRRHTNRLQILSDDGGMQVEGRECKTADDTSKFFRSLIVELYAR